LPYVAYYYENEPNPMLKGKYLILGCSIVGACEKLNSC